MRKNVKTYSFDDESILGEGGFARVFLARNEGADTDAALKILKPEFEDNSYVVESFFRDPTVMRALDHKNIIKILDVGAPTEKPFYLSMEYCQGGDLRRILQRKGKLAIASVLGYAVTLCDALAY
ncbi:MAG TPA: protein kinase, partial [Bacteroidota bacterium]